MTPEQAKEMMKNAKSMAKHAKGLIDNLQNIDLGQNLSKEEKKEIEKRVRLEDLPEATAKLQDRLKELTGKYDTFSR